MNPFSDAVAGSIPRSRFVVPFTTAARTLLITCLAAFLGLTASTGRTFNADEGKTVQPASASRLTPASEASTPVLILLHGATLNHAMWNSVRRHLDPRWRVIALDLPGHGARRAERFTLAASIESVADTARAVAPARVVLVGDSLGGYAALAAAASGRLPREQLIGLVVGGCGGKVEGTALWTMRLEGGVVRVLTALAGEDRLVRTRVPQRLRGMGQQQADIDAMIAADIHLDAFPQIVEALAHVDFMAEVARIPQPILFFNGEQDDNAMAIEASFVASAPRATTWHFPGEHGVTLRHPAEFADMTNDFVERVSAGVAR